MAHNQYGQFGYGQNNQESEPLPAGWEMMIDKQTGWPFFVDHHTQQTTWTDPRKTKQPQQQTAQNQRVREIPVFHENSGGRNTPTRMDPDPPGFRMDTPPRTDSPGQRDVPVFQIPVHHEQQPQNRGGTPTRQGIPIHVQQEGRSSPGFKSGSPQSNQQWAAQHGFPKFGSNFGSASEPRWTRDIPIMRDEPDSRFGSMSDGAARKVTGIPIIREREPQGEGPGNYQSAAYQQHQPAPQTEAEQPSPTHYQGQPVYKQNDNHHQGPTQFTAQTPHTYQSAAQPAPAPNAEPVPEPIPAHAPPNHGPVDQLKVEERAAKGRSPSPAPANVGPVEHCQMITAEAEKLRDTVEAFTGTKKDKTYLYTEEMLTRLLIKLDRIESNGQDEIRKARKEGVRMVQGTLDQLELKLMSNAAPAPSQKAYGQQRQTSQNGSSNASHVTEMVLDSEVGC